jgi:hypothetical protein
MMRRISKDDRKILQEKGRKEIKVKERNKEKEGMLFSLIFDWI